MSGKEFVCRRCGHAATTKQNLIKHLNNKEKCEVLEGFEHISIEEHIASLKKKPSKDAVACKFCGSLFNHANYMKSHYAICKRNPDSDKFEGHSTSPPNVHQTLAIIHEELKSIKKENISLRKENNELKRTIEELKKQIPSNNINIINSGSGTVNINQYITQNITIKNFGEETLDHISEQFLLSCIMRESTGIRNLVEKIHFDQDVPENKNVRYKSTKRKIMEIVENNDWVAKDEKEVIRQMIRKASSILREYYYQDDSLMERDEKELHMKVLGFLDEINEYKRKYSNARDMLKALIETNRT